ncbi:uncharacterized protein [Misgurnus anguillicaudatus]|uniref:uncharacterized protein n=1 Tax=Misgurnus anguillicaudatus TaxID=75329 RepID=UPI003CCF5F16
MSELTPADRAAAPPSPALSTAEEACPEEKAMVKVEDTEEEASSSDHVLSPVSGSGSVTSSLTEGSSSVVDDWSGVEPLSMEPVLSLPWIGEVVPRDEMKPPATVKEGFPEWKDLWYTVDFSASRKETTTPPSTSAGGTHQENIKDHETKDLKARAEILVFDLVRFSGCGYVSAEFRFKVGRTLVDFALTSEEACSLVRKTLDREMLRLRKEESSPQKLIHLYRFIKRYPMIFVGMKCQLSSWVLEDLYDSDLSSEDESDEVVPAAAPAPADPPAVILPSPPPAPAPAPADTPAVVLASPPPAPAPAPADPPAVILPSPPPAHAPADPPAVILPSPPPAPAPADPPPVLLPSPPPAPADPPAVILPSPPPAPADPPAGVPPSPSVSQPSPPDGSTAPVETPQPQTPPSSQQTSADKVEDKKVETSLPSPPSPPDGSTAPVAPPQPQTPPSSQVDCEHY